MTTLFRITVIARFADAMVGHFAAGSSAEGAVRVLTALGFAEAAGKAYERRLLGSMT